MSDKRKYFKPEINVPLWLEIIPHERFGFSPYEGENPETVFDGKKIPASKYWVFTVRPEVGGETMGWSVRKKEIADTVEGMAKEQAAKNQSAKIAVMLFEEKKRHFVCLFSSFFGPACLPGHEIPDRFTAFCKQAPAPVPVSTPGPTQSSPSIANRDIPQTNGRLDWAAAGEAMQNALAVAKTAWEGVLEEAYGALAVAEESGDQMEMTKAIKLAKVFEEAAAHGIPATAHTLFIEVVRGGQRR